MQFFKKNPEIKWSITVQKVLLEDDTIVCGDEFAMFADPRTLPGSVVKLVSVDVKDLTEEQLKQVGQFSVEMSRRPPKHLPPTSSENFMTDKTSGDLQIIKAPTPKPVEKKITKEDIKEVVSDITGKTPKKLSELYSRKEIAEILPGVTEKNAKRVLDGICTLRDLSLSSNTKLRKVGIMPAYYKKARDTAARLLSEKKSK